VESEQYVSPLLAFASIAIVFAVLIGTMLAELPFAGPVRALFERHTQKLTFLVALTATGSSLYYSEVVGFIPCEFCWFQRICVYPLAILLGVAVFTRYRLDPRFIIALAVIGLGLSIYHYQLQLFPDQGEVCQVGVVSCTDKNVDQFGFVSIPFMAGAGFLTILLLQMAEWRVDVLYRRWSEPKAADGVGAALRA
jgi:disulfide bond formation protein DsbB